MPKIITAITLCTLLATQAFACQVPVFRYALERWQASQYRLQVLHQAPLVKLTTKKHTNIKVEYYRADTLTENQKWTIIGLDQIKEYPTHILTAPSSLQIPHPILVKKSTPQSWQTLTDSPARTAIKDKLLAGDSAVFLHLLSGDKTKDAATRTLLENALAKAQNTIQLPEGIIHPDGVADAQSKGDIDFDDILRSQIPLKIAFSIVTLDPRDPAEQDFIHILLQGNTIDQIPEPSLIAPIFGRGRCLALIPASKLSENIILDQCQYLCNACACSVKGENPGFDLIINANWDEKLINSTIFLEKKLPDLTGTGDFIIPPPIDSEPPNPVVHSLQEKERNLFEPLYITFKILFAAFLLAILAGTIYLYKKSKT